MSNEGKHLHQFTRWLEKELKEKGKISMSEVICSGAEKMNCTIDTTKKYLGKALLLKSSKIKLNMDESKGIKFLEYRNDFRYTGDRRKHEEYHGMENLTEEQVAPEDSEKNIYGMKHEGEKYDSDKDPKEDIEKEE